MKTGEIALELGIKYNSVRKIICTFIGEAFFCKHITIDYNTNNVSYVSNGQSVDTKTQKYLIKYYQRMKF